LSIELERHMFRRAHRFEPGSELELEWTAPSGPMHIRARVAAAGPGRAPTVQVEVMGEPEPLERRGHDRGRVTLEVSGWTLAQATRRLAGSTVDLSPSGALLAVPELAAHAATLELQIALPGGPLRASATIRRRAQPGLIGVEFTRIDPEQRARVVEFLRSR
jgi:hypothetical protein